MKWVSLLRNLSALLVGIAFGFAIFGGLQYYFKPEFWISIAVSVVGGLYAAIVPLLDFVKKVQEVRKLNYEVRKLEREEQAAEREKNSRIQSPTVDELQQHGRSAIERMLEQRYRNEGPDALNPKRFVVDSSEKKI
jgi:hypothetical protein